MKSEDAGFGRIGEARWMFLSRRRCWAIDKPNLEERPAKGLDAETAAQFSDLETSQGGISFAGFAEISEANWRGGCLTRLLHEYLGEKPDRPLHT